jgi:hypothetical protein
MRTSCLFIFLLVFSPSFCFSGSDIRSQAGIVVTSDEQARAQEFWFMFRELVLKEDWPALAKMCATPLQVRGDLDATPVRKVASKNLAEFLKRKMAQVVYEGKGKPARTLAVLVRDTPNLMAADWVDPDQIRVQNLSFRKVASTWKLTLIYEDDL